MCGIILASCLGAQNTTIRTTVPEGLAALRLLSSSNE